MSTVCDKKHEVDAQHKRLFGRFTTAGRLGLVSGDFQKFAKLPNCSVRKRKKNKAM